MIYNKDDSDYRKMSALYKVIHVVNKGIVAYESDLFMAKNTFDCDQRRNAEITAEGNLREAKKAKAWLLEFITEEFTGE